MSHCLLVDESHLIMRNLNIPDLAKLHTKDSNKYPIGGIFGVFSSINKCLKDNPTIDRVYLLKDGYAKWRKDLFPEYKSSRGNNPDSPKYKSYITPDIFGWSPKDTISWTRKKLNEMSESFGLRSIYDEVSEADDLSYLVGKELLESGNKITYLTSDKDWSQLIHIFKDYDISIFDGMKNEIISKYNFKEKYGIDPEWFIFMKAMQGDGSDDIPGVVKGLGEKSIIKLIEMAQEKGLHFDNETFISDLYSLIDSLDESTLGRSKVIKQLTTEEAKYNLDRNIKLVDFRKCPHKSILKEQINTENNKEIKFNTMKAAMYFKELKFEKLTYILHPDSPWNRLN